MNKNFWTYILVSVVSTLFGILIGRSFFPIKIYPHGAPVIVDKSQSLNGKATYTYEGYGRRENFEDEFERFSVGDTLPKVISKINSVDSTNTDIIPEGVNFENTDTSMER